VTWLANPRLPLLPIRWPWQVRLARAPLAATALVRLRASSWKIRERWQWRGRMGNLQRLSARRRSRGNCGQTTGRGEADVQTVLHPFGKRREDPATPPFPVRSSSALVIPEVPWSVHPALPPSYVEGPDWTVAVGAHPIPPNGQEGTPTAGIEYGQGDLQRMMSPARTQIHSAPFTPDSQDAPESPSRGPNSRPNHFEARDRDDPEGGCMAPEKAPPLASWAHGRAH
jgi:hypothetical protein